MTKHTAGLFVGLSATLVGLWIYSQRAWEEEQAAERGEVIFSNAPRAD
jgi:hypothetical protein